ncbi:hypothetical protein BS78_06G028800 [Paspalum vaginatum]|nr:hypothetical protein BS78_06G028800 [Paspalum vaginatum]
MDPPCAISAPPVDRAPARPLADVPMRHHRTLRVRCAHAREPLSPPPETPPPKRAASHAAPVLQPPHRVPCRVPPWACTLPWPRLPACPRLRPRASDNHACPISPPQRASRTTSPAHDAAPESPHLPALSLRRRPAIAVAPRGCRSRATIVVDSQVCD